MRGSRLGGRYGNCRSGGRGILRCNRIETGRDDGNTHFVAIGIVQSKTPDDLGLGVNGLAYKLGGGGSFLQLQIGRAGNVDQRAVGTLDALLEQRGADGDFGGLGGAVFAPRGTNAEQRSTSATKNGVHVGEIDVNVGIHRNEVGDALHAGEECGIGRLEGFDDTDGTVGKLKQAIVRDDDQRVDFLAQVVDAVFGGSGTLRTFEAERTSDNRDGESTLLMSRTSDDRAGAGTGATTLTAGDEHHVGTLQGFLDIRLMILCGLSTLLRVRASAESAAGLIGQGDFHVGVGAQKILRIGIYRHKFNILQSLGNHAIDGITAGTADANNLDVGLVVELILRDLAHVWLLSLHGYTQE